MNCFVLNGWAAGPETWDLCTFRRDRLFNYLEELDGEPLRALTKVDAAILVGFSMGGSIALQMLLKCPEKIQGLVLVAATPRMIEDATTGWKGLSERRLTALWAGTRMFHEDDTTELFQESNLVKGIDYLRQTDLRDDLCALVARTPRLTKIPVRILQGERDGIVRPANADFLAKLFPQAVVTRIPGAEHTLPLTVPKMIDSAVFDIITAYENE